MHRLQLRYERVVANAGDALMMLRVAGWAVTRGAGASVAVCERRADGAAVRADSQWLCFFEPDDDSNRALPGIGDEGAASLAPSLGRMTQLMTLNLSRTLRVSAAAVRWAVVCERRRCADDAAGCGPRRLPAGLGRMVGSAMGEPMGRRCVQTDNRIGDDGAASLAPSLARMPQLTTLDLSRTLRASAAAAL